MINKLAISAHAKFLGLKDRLLTNEEGASSVEWILIVVGLAVAIAALLIGVTAFFNTQIGKL